VDVAGGAGAGGAGAGAGGGGGRSPLESHRGRAADMLARAARHGAGGCWRRQRQSNQSGRGVRLFRRRWGRATDALARAAIRPRLAAAGAVESSGVIGGLGWLGSRQGWAADASARAACLRALALQ
jgi:hypothetical protein